MERHNVSMLLMAGLLLFGFVDQSYAKVPTNKQEAMGIILKSNSIWNRGNVLLSVGLDYKNREMNWNSVLSDIGQYIKNVDRGLLPSFEKLNFFGQALFKSMILMYENDIKPMLPKEDQRTGIISTQETDIINKINFLTKCPKGTRCVDRLGDDIRFINKTFNFQRTPPKSLTLMAIRTELEKTLKQYNADLRKARESMFTPKAKGDAIEKKIGAVEVLIFLAERMNHYVVRFMTDYDTLMKIVDKAIRKELQGLDIQEEPWGVEQAVQGRRRIVVD